MRIFFRSVRLGTMRAFEAGWRGRTAATTSYACRGCVESQRLERSRAKLAKPNKRGARIKDVLKLGAN